MILKNEIKIAIETFMNGRQRNAWLDIDNIIKVYVRKGKHLIDEVNKPIEIKDTFDVANIEIKESERGKGHFTLLLDILEEKNYNVYVENVMEQRLFPFLKSRGFIKCGNDCCMYKESK